MWKPHISKERRKFAHNIILHCAFSTYYVSHSRIIILCSYIVFKMTFEMATYYYVSSFISFFSNVLSVWRRQYIQLNMPSRHLWKNLFLSWSSQPFAFYLMQGSHFFHGLIRSQCLKEELSLEAFNIFVRELDEHLVSILINFVSGPRDGRHNHYGKWQILNPKKNLIGWKNKRLNQTRWRFTG